MDCVTSTKDVCVGDRFARPQVLYFQLYISTAVKGATSRYFEVLFGPLKIIVNYKETLKLMVC